MAYKIQEIFYSVQGEGFHAGKPAIFLRFMHCNFWTGNEADRASAVCRFCDTQFMTPNPNLMGGRYAHADELVERTLSLWPKNSLHRPFVVLTGGEPMLQVDAELIDAFHRLGTYLAIETNGSLVVPDTIDWICVSPKTPTLVQNHGDELKLVFPQETLGPEDFDALSFQHFYLQPMDNSAQSDNTQKALAYCLADPRWTLSLQLQKILAIK
jgi:7-carboxy-7-deazaguanine synthase (Cx14CxxC type)